MKNKNVVVKQEVGNEIQVEIMAKSIVEISAAMKVLTQSRFKQEAVLALIKDRTGISKTQIHQIWDELINLEKNFLK